MSDDRLIRADLHNHTHYSPDSILSPERFVREARRRRLDCVAVTDHNTIQGALIVREIAGNDLTVILGEEVRTAEGEVIGLFLSEAVPSGLPAAETVDRIKAQGGLAGVPHPFDYLRSALRRDVMMSLLERIDFIETLNARMVFASHNSKALKLAKDYGKAMSAGSDAHSPWEVGRAYVEIPAFSGAQDFLAKLRLGTTAGTLSSPLVHMVSRYAVLRRKLGWRPA